MEKVKKKRNFFKRFFNNFLFLYFVAVFLSKILKYILFSYYLIIILTSKIIKISNFIYYNITIFVLNQKNYLYAISF